MPERERSYCFDAETRMQIEPKIPHHWVIGPPEGSYALGTCRNCGEEREFFQASFNPWAGYSGGSKRTRRIVEAISDTEGVIDPL